MKTPPELLRLINLRRKGFDSGADQKFMDRIQEQIRTVSMNNLSEGFKEAAKRVGKVTMQVEAATNQIFNNDMTPPDHGYTRCKGPHLEDLE
ncbi:MAG: hypothetical protein O6939_03540 [Bacteroidetes bacterium]|nr:hypothetical protein [Bacteroidota bacterium]